ncbi:MAG: hypothetical protein WCG80_14275 [Spirochaetales bacterium]
MKQTPTFGDTGAARLGMALVFGLLATLAFAADKPKTDKDLIQGLWSVSEGTYSDGTLETELEMSFAFTADALTNPMDNTKAPYTLDEKAKTVTSKGKDSTMVMKYRFVDATHLEIVEMTVTAKKAMTIVGAKGTFSLLKLKKSS